MFEQELDVVAFEKKLAKKVGKKMAKNALGCFLKRIPRKMQTVI
jgi:hypothetical protein